MRTLLAVLAAVALARPALGVNIRVPQDHSSIQAAVDAATAGDTVVVGPGTYRERIRLKSGITVRSEGTDAQGIDGLKRAEITVIDGDGNDGTSPGVVMAEGSTLDGFTITNVGAYDESLWKKHYDSHGEQLGDDEGSAGAEGTTPAVSIPGVNCTVRGCIVHHNGDVGIGILGHRRAKAIPLVTGNIVYRNMGGGIGVALGSGAIVRGNICRENLRAGIGCRAANPIISGNECHDNIRAGIGCREEAEPVIRGNTCYRNRRAGIGIRMTGTAPVVEDNECSENALAGIGCRDGASPIIRNNVCRRNTAAGIGCDGAEPLIVGNKCEANARAGIGVRGKADVMIKGNTCVDNKLVAIGVIGESRATISGNDLSRTKGMPPIVAVKDGSTVLVLDNRITGGGVAAILVQGKATISGNTFAGIGEKQSHAVWVWENSTATVRDNSFDGYRAAVTAVKATVVITGNTVTRFRGPTIVVRDSPTPAHVYRNTAISGDPSTTVVEVTGAAGIVGENAVKPD